ncbi:MAG: glucokinase [Gallionellaceae bacterium]|jgi:glucokinase
MIENIFLSGDIGGTKTLLQVFSAGEAQAPLLQKSYPSAAYSGLEKIIAEFLQEANVRQITAACFALAGPVAGRKVVLTNLPWVVDADDLESRFNIPQVSLINDFEAVGLGVAALKDNDILVLQSGAAQVRGGRLVVGAGTGLGVAWMTWDDGQYAVHPSEGGHLDFAPGDDLQYALLQYLQARHGHVSYERIVSGPGLAAIYEFLRDTQRAKPSAELISAFACGDGAAAVANFAIEKQEPIAQQALQLFVQIYGAFVGNMALAALPRGGIFIAGGIAAKIISVMQNGEFMRAFLAKGRFTGLLTTLPMYIVTNPQIGLLGASNAAERA